MFIHWWWTTQPPYLHHHGFASHNWSRPLEGDGLVGELPGAPRPWRNGSKPPGACGQAPPVPVSCSQFRTDWNLTATLTTPDGSNTQPMLYEPPVNGYQAGHLFVFGMCSQWSVTLSCISGPPDQLRVVVTGAEYQGPLHGSDDIRLSFTDSPDIFPLIVSCPNVAQGCLGAGAGSVTVRIDQVASAGRRRPLALR